MQTTDKGPAITETSEQGAAKVEQFADRAQETVARVAEQSAAKIEELGGNAQEVVGRAAESTASAIRHAGERGEELSREWHETQDAWTRTARAYVREHPITSVAIAFGIGLLLDRLTSR